MVFQKIYLSIVKFDLLEPKTKQYIRTVEHEIVFKKTDEDVMKCRAIFRELLKYKESKYLVKFRELKHLKELGEETYIENKHLK